MAVLPEINDLPSVLRTDGWEWELFKTPGCPSYDFWTGTDSNGQKWITKLRGGFSGYREIVFAHLAQKMGWSCQVSVFAIFDEKSLNKLQIDKNNNIHAVHWFMSEHSFENCTDNCPLLPLREGNKSIKKLKNISVNHILDWPKSVFAACILGAGEPSDAFFTSSHEFVIIDSEQMFQCAPGDLRRSTEWCKNLDGSWLKSAKELKLEVCRNIAGISDDDLEKSLKIPEGVSFGEPWSIAENIFKSRNYARQLWKKGLLT